MNRIIFLSLSFLLFVLPLAAQDEEVFSNASVFSSDDTEAYVDSSLLGHRIFDTMPGGVVINQSSAVREALEAQVNENAGKKFYGFRVRIFLSSAQDAREASSRAYNLFSRLYPDIPIYRIYDSPNFRVTVGNFRTRLEADTFAKSVRGNFPTASVMRERFKYPSIGRTDMTARDTTAVEMFLIEE